MLLVSLWDVLFIFAGLFLELPLFESVVTYLPLRAVSPPFDGLPLLSCKRLLGSGEVIFLSSRLIWMDLRFFNRSLPGEFCIITCS